MKYIICVSAASEKFYPLTLNPLVCGGNSNRSKVIWFTLDHVETSRLKNLTTELKFLIVHICVSAFRTLKNSNFNQPISLLRFINVELI